RSLSGSSSVCEREYRFWGWPTADLEEGAASLRSLLPEGDLYTRQRDGVDILSICEPEQPIYQASPLGEWLPYLQNLPIDHAGCRSVSLFVLVCKNRIGLDFCSGAIYIRTIASFSRRSQRNLRHSEALHPFPTYTIPFRKGSL